MKKASNCLNKIVWLKGFRFSEPFRKDIMLFFKNQDHKKDF